MFSPKRSAVPTRDGRVLAHVGGTIERAIRRVSSSESVKKFLVLGEDFRADRDEVTPTMKLKRDVVARHYAAELRSLYSQ